MSELVGQTLLGRYRIDAFLGRGGMADVYRSWDRQRSVALALKVMRPELAEDRVFVRRFRREAEVLARLQHPNVVRFYGLEQAGRLVFILMDFIDGTSLRTAIFEAARPLPLGSVLAVAQPVCAALHFAHAQGLVHCDVKPANILLDRSGRAFLSDFGIAHLAESATQTVRISGTPAYMSPEQCRGEPVTGRSDIYALGIVLYELLTGGERPFSGDTPNAPGSTLARLYWEHINQLPSLPSAHNRSLAPDIDTVVLRCLAKQAEARYASALDLYAELEAAAGHPPLRPVAVAGTGAATAPGASAFPRLGRRRLALFVLAGVLALALGLGAISAAAQFARATPTPEGVTDRPTLAAVDTRPVTASGASATAPQGPVTYPVSGCLSYFVDGTSEGMEMTECVTAVTVRPDGNLHLDFEWTLTVHDPAWSGIQFQSDANNRNMYLTDNRGRRLDHLGVGGEALVESALQDGDRRTGWFLFPPLEGGATSFVFHDDDHGAATTPIERVWP